MSILVTELIIIAPYWNVNNVVGHDYLKLIKIIIAPYWNVNDGIFTSNTHSGLIIIAPYWNVNEATGNYSIVASNIIIAPYWNVNTDLEEQDKQEIDNNNSTILECKFGSCND